MERGVVPRGRAGDLGGGEGTERGGAGGVTRRVVWGVSHACVVRHLDLACLTGCRNQPCLSADLAAKSADILARVPYKVLRSNQSPRLVLA